MSKARERDTVQIHYTVKTQDNRVFTTHENGHPLEFEIGNRDVISGLENGVLGMEIGETKAITVSPDEGFGHRKQELVDTIRRSDFPDHNQPVVGQVIEVGQPNGRNLTVYVTGIKGDQITIDANHPLAGHTLEFKIELMDIK
jgi:FKBP-type peptidyl-prolyl cis-trans isomerase 2